MHKIKRINSDQNRDEFILNAAINKSPLRRNTVAYGTSPQKSPLRTRTPIRDTSPKHNHQQNIRYIPNISPLKNRSPQYQNIHQLSNQKSIRYICHQYEQHPTYKINTYNLKSDRVPAQETKLFGKIVSKLNSQKKNQQRVITDTAYPTSIFQHSDQKPQFTPNKSEKSSFKQLLNKNMDESGNKNTSSNSKRQSSTPQQAQSINCLVYKIKNNHLGVNKNGINYMQGTNQAIEANNLKQYKSNTHDQKYTDVSRKLFPDSTNQHPMGYSDIQILLNKLEETYQPSSKDYQQQQVKISLQIGSSLSMDPYL